MAERHLSAREKSLILVIAGLVAGSALYGFVAEPIYTHWKTLDAKIASKTAYLMKGKRLLLACKSLEKEHVNLPALDRARDSEEKEVAKALSSIEGISNASNCLIQNVKPRPSKKVGAYRELSFDVTAEGTIEDISRFLYELETSKGILRVKHFTISSTQASSGRLKGAFLITKILVD